MDKEYIFNNILDELNDLFEYRFFINPDGTFKRYDMQCKEYSQDAFNELDIINFYIDIYQDKIYMLDSNETETRNHLNDIIYQLIELKHK